MWPSWKMADATNGPLVEMERAQGKLYKEKERGWELSINQRVRSKEKGWELSINQRVRSFISVCKYPLI